MAVAQFDQRPERAQRFRFGFIHLAVGVEIADRAGRRLVAALAAAPAGCAAAGSAATAAIAELPDARLHERFHKRLDFLLAPQTVAVLVEGFEPRQRFADAQAFAARQS